MYLADGNIAATDTEVHLAHCKEIPQLPPAVVSDHSSENTYMKTKLSIARLAG